MTPWDPERVAQLLARSAQLRAESERQRALWRAARARRLDQHLDRCEDELHWMLEREQRAQLARQRAVERLLRSVPGHLVLELRANGGSPLIGEPQPIREPEPIGEPEAIGEPQPFPLTAAGD